MPGPCPPLHLRQLTHAFALSLSRRSCVPPPRDGCITIACMLGRADADCSGTLSLSELDGFDEELSSLLRTLPPSVRVRRMAECRAALEVGGREEGVSMRQLKEQYVPCRSGGIRLE